MLRHLYQDKSKIRPRIFGQTKLLVRQRKADKTGSSTKLQLNGYRKDCFQRQSPDGNKLRMKKEQASTEFPACAKHPAASGRRSISK
jgi:hypothetical protein